MRHSLLLAFVFLCSTVFFVFISGCAPKDPNSASKELQKQLDEDKKKNDELIEKLKYSYEQGGQPGAITVSGVVVTKDGIDERITILSRAGVGKDGTEPAVANAYKPVLLPKAKEIDLSKLASDKTLIAIGCEANSVTDLAESRGLRIVSTPEPLTKDMMILSANTILLCRQMASLQYTFLTIQADELILDGLFYTQTALTGFTVLNTNTLTIYRASSIVSKGLDSSMTVSLMPSLELNVLKELKSREHGKLLLGSTGPNYKASEK